MADQRLVSLTEHLNPQNQYLWMSFFHGRTFPVNSCSAVGMSNPIGPVGETCSHAEEDMDSKLDQDNHIFNPSHSDESLRRDRAHRWEGAPRKVLIALPAAIRRELDERSPAVQLVTQMHSVGCVVGGDYIFGGIPASRIKETASVKLLPSAGLVS